MTKYEDGKILSHSIFTEIFNGNLTKEEYHQIESNILQMVEFKINLETVLDAHSLLETVCQINQSQKDLFLELYYFIILSGFIQIKPYYIALVCHALILQEKPLV
jgi:hypothetical protein